MNIIRVNEIDHCCILNFETECEEIHEMNKKHRSTHIFEMLDILSGIVFHWICINFISRNFNWEGGNLTFLRFTFVCLQNFKQVLIFLLSFDRIMFCKVKFTRRYTNNHYGPFHNWNDFIQFNFNVCWQCFWNRAVNKSDTPTRTCPDTSGQTFDGWAYKEPHPPSGQDWPSQLRNKVLFGSWSINNKINSWRWPTRSRFVTTASLTWARTKRTQPKSGR